MRPLEVVLLCPAGFERVVAHVASVELSNFVQNGLSGGFIRGHTVAPVQRLRRFSAATNVFGVVTSVRRSRLDAELRQLATELRSNPRPTGLPKKGSCRLRVHDDGSFASTSTDAGRQLERSFSEWAGLPINRAAAKVEVWAIRRVDEKEVVLATKLTGGEIRPTAGQLRPEICAALAHTCDLSEADLVVDPFAGSGAIGEALAEAGARRVLLNDIAPPDARVDMPTTRIEWTRGDFRNMDVAPNSVDAIVTDPPWGHFKTGEVDVEGIYADLGALAKRWLKAERPLVVLTGAPKSAVRLLTAANGLTEEASFPVLVNGHKAQVLVAKKPPT